MGFHSNWHGLAAICLLAMTISQFLQKVHLVICIRAVRNDYLSILARSSCKSHQFTLFPNRAQYCHPKVYALSICVIELTRAEHGIVAPIFDSTEMQFFDHYRQSLTCCLNLFCQLIQFKGNYFQRPDSAIDSGLALAIYIWGKKAGGENKNSGTIQRRETVKRSNMWTGSEFRVDNLLHRIRCLFIWILVGLLQSIWPILLLNQDLRFLQLPWIYWTGVYKIALLYEIAHTQISDTRSSREYFAPSYRKYKMQIIEVF
jgi:hypothetical protein